MLKLDEDALRCDLAETYHIFDYRRLPLQTVAVFVIGLHDNSRIKKKLNKVKASPDTLLLAGILDRLNALLWTKTKDAQHKRNFPQSIMAEMFEKESNVDGFVSGKDFETRRNELLLKVKGG